MFMRSRNREPNPMMDLYQQAATLENALGAEARRDPYALVQGSLARDFNRLLEAARAELPKSIALRGDMELIEGDVAPTADQTYRAVHVTLIPTLQNALPDEDYVAI